MGSGPVAETGVEFAVCCSVSTMHPPLCFGVGKQTPEPGKEALPGRASKPVTRPTFDIIVRQWREVRLRNHSDMTVADLDGESAHMFRWPAT